MSNKLRIKAFSKKHDIAEATLRHIRHYSQERKNSRGEAVPSNGFASAFLKLGRAVYIDEDEFLGIWLRQNGRAEQGSQS